MSERQDQFYTYCCKDSAITFECNKELTPKLSQPSLNHYELNMALLNPFLYMELNGILYDKKLAQKRLKEINQIIYSLQYELDLLSGMGIILNTDKQSLRERISDTCCFKRDATTPKKDYEDVFQILLKITEKEGLLSPEEAGFINSACNWSLNVKGSSYKDFLYETLQLPKQYRTDPETKRKSLSTDGEALLELQKKSPHRAVDLGIQIMELRTRAQMLVISTDRDGRVRCSYDVVGAVTGRTTCRKSPTGSGMALQTTPDDYKSLDIGHPLRQGMRDLFLADPGYRMFQCDLKGSDGWTIGAHLARLGDRTMLDDLIFGIKPAARICYMLRHGNNSLIGLTRAEIKELLKEVKKDDWDYFACKIAIWGICYLMGIDLLGKQIAEESYGKMWLSRTDLKDFHAAVFAAYRPDLWHRATEALLFKRPELLSPSGHLRRFFDRPQNRLGQALAHEPQSVTTYATNLAAYKLWTDRDNRITTDGQLLRSPIDSTGTIASNTNNYTQRTDRVVLKIQPLHQVHDALIGQFKIEDTSWAIGKIKSYFANEIIIAGTPITIPFEGTYGPNWGNLTLGTI